MGNKRYLGLGLVMLVAIFFVFAGAGAAFAQTGLEGVGQVIDGPDQPVLGDPVGQDRSPHGGYSAITDYCLQCHNIHGGGGTVGADENYALLRQDTISAVCNTCHSLGSTEAGIAAATAATNATRVDAGTGGTASTTNGQNWTPTAPVTISNAEWDPFNPNYVTFTVSGGLPPVAGASVHIDGVVSKTCDRNTTAGGDGACLHAYYLTDRYSITGYRSASSGGSRVLASGTTAEVQTVTLSPTMTGTKSFKIQLPANLGGGTTAAIVNGTNYDALGIKTVMEATAGWPAGETVTASAVAAGSFVLTFAGPVGDVGSVVIVNGVGVNEVQTVTLTMPVGANETQSVNMNGATGGVYRLTFNDGATSDTTGNIGPGDPLGAITSSLEALSNIGVGDVLLTAGAGNDYFVEFQGALARTNFGGMAVTDSTTGGGPVTVTTPIDGAPNPAGNFTLTYDPAVGPTQTTGNLPYNETTANVQAALVGLSGIGSGGVVVTGSPGAYTLTFGGNVASRDLVQLTSTPGATFNGTIAHATTTQGAAGPSGTVATTTGGGLNANQFRVLWMRSTTRVVPDPGVMCDTAGSNCLGLAGFDSGGTAIDGKSVNPTVQSSDGKYGLLGNPKNVGSIWDPAPGTAATRTAYDVASPQSAHGIGDSPPPDSGGMPGPGDTLVQFTDFGSIPSNSTNAINSSGNWTNNNTRVDPTATSTHESEGTANEGGLTCVSCHTPHGDFGQLINARYIWYGATGTSGGGTTNLASPLRPNEANGDGAATNYALYKVMEGTAVNRMDLTAGGSVASVGTTLGSGKGYLKAPTALVPYWQTCTNTLLTLGCVPWQMRDQAGQIVSTYGYKLLSAFPNHDYAVPASWGGVSANTDQQSFCGKCHPSRVNASMPVAWTQVPGYGNPDGQTGAITTGNAGTYHNHPTACTYCHGNPAIPDETGAAFSRDFPHTSENTSLLKAYPDGLCITCHNNLP